MSEVSAEGGPFHDATADAALFDAVRRHLRPGIELIELDCAINDAQFARACAQSLMGNISLLFRRQVETPKSGVRPDLPQFKPSGNCC
jgi:hypothetical protein